MSTHCKLSTKGKEGTPGGRRCTEPMRRRGSGMGFQGTGHRHKNSTQNTLQLIQLEGRKSLFKSSLQELWRPFLVQKDGAIVFLNYRNPSSLISRKSKLRTWKALKATAHSGVRNSGAEVKAGTLGLVTAPLCQCWMLGKLCILSTFGYNMKVNSVYLKRYFED